MMKPGAIANDRIGPNAIIQVIESVTAKLGRDATRALFLSAGLEQHLQQRPKEMVAERDVAVLQSELHKTFGPEVAREISRDAGWRTGDYLLTNRIPSLAQWLLKRIPAPLAAGILARVIGRHSWTFSGSGTFSYAPGRPFRFSIKRNPICSRIRSDVPVCDYYAATFERIFREIVHPNTRVVEMQCEATGADACIFEANW